MFLVNIIYKLVKNPIPLVFISLLLLLPTTNSGIDGYAYASSIKWEYELIWPHHLLYVPFGRLVYLIFPYIEPLSLMKIVNALAAGISLMILRQILIKINVNGPNSFVFFAGSCFGFMRFSTENETYIIPILFCLAATFFYLQFLKAYKNYNLILSGFGFGLACLFHQIHIMWYLGFIISLSLNFNVKKNLIFILSGILPILISYGSVYYLWVQNDDFIHFVLRDLYHGQVTTTLDLNNFILTPINFIRSFIQIHGYMKSLLSLNPFLFLVPITFVIILGLSLKAIIKYSAKLSMPQPIFSKAVFMAFWLQFAFAFYSVGNAEFMVMLPILLLLWLVANYFIPPKPIFYISSMLLAWNLVFGLAPMHFLDLDGRKPLIKKIEEYTNAKWILAQPQKIENYLDYNDGPGYSASKIIRLEKNHSAKDSLIKWLETYEILTDVIENHTTFGRQTITHSNTEQKNLINFFKHTKVDSIQYFGGKSQINKLSVK